MPMKNRDALERERIEQANALAAALRDGNEEEVAKALAAYADSVQQRILAEAEMYRNEADAVVLAGRGIRQLTSEEREFYQSASAAMRDNPQQSMNTQNMRMPETIITEILGAVKSEHPLLQMIDFTPTSMMTTWVINKQGPQAAVWGEVTAQIVTELYGESNTEQVSLKKLSAYFPVSNALLDLGPEWLDRYIREICTESIALGVEIAIIDGSGKDCPVGMNRNIDGDFSATTGYPKKEAIVVEFFSPEEYGALAANLAVDDTGKARNVDDLTIIVNPLDYLKIIMPATIRETLDGGYVRDVFPLPTQIIKSSAVELGKAVFGLVSKYFFGIGRGTDGGKLEYSDHQNFLFDQRLYRIKLYGEGKPKDNKAFSWLDISGLKRHVPTVGYAVAAADSDEATE